MYCINSVSGPEFYRAAREEIVIRTCNLVVFSLDEQRYALPLDTVETVIRAAALTPLPKAPDIILGILDLHGEVVPVVNIRKRFQLAERALNPADQFIVARAGSLRVALVADAALDILALEQDALPSDSIVPGLEYVCGVARTGDGLILIHDLSTFLSLEEKHSLTRALEHVND